MQDRSDVSVTETTATSAAAADDEEVNEEQKKTVVDRVRLLTTRLNGLANGVDPSSDWFYQWQAVVACTVFYNTVVVVFRVVCVGLLFDLSAVVDFTGSQGNDSSSSSNCSQADASRIMAVAIVFVTLDWACDIVYVADVIVRMHICYYDDGSLVHDLKLLRRHYRLSVGCVLDLLSVVPTDLFYLIPPMTFNRPYIRFNRLLKLGRVSQFVHHTEFRTRHPATMRFIFILIMLLVMIHWNACIFIALSEAIGFGSDTWVYNARPKCADEAEVILMYCYSFLWSMLMLLGIGNIPPPETDFEYVFHITEILFSVLLIATVIGQMSSFVSSANSHRSEFLQVRDSIKSYLSKDRLVTGELQGHVVRWLDHVWNERHSLTAVDDQVLEVLPNSLRTEIYLHVYSESLRNVSIFSDCDQALLRRIVPCMRHAVFSPGDYVCRKGDVGREMYIIKSGQLVVVSDDSRVVYATLSEGGYFGELSLLNFDAGDGRLKTNGRRMANVLSVGYSDLFVLSKDDLWNAIDEFPEAKQRLINAGRKRIGELNKGTSQTATATSNGGVDSKNGSSSGVDATEEAPEGFVTVEDRLAKIKRQLEQAQTSAARLSAGIQRSRRQLLARINKLNELQELQQKQLQLRTEPQQLQQDEEQLLLAVEDAAS